MSSRDNLRAGGTSGADAARRTPEVFLSQETLAGVRKDVRRPQYDRRAIQTGIVHFGPGAFHRVHQAWFIENLLAHDPRWGLCDVSLCSAGTRDALAPQDGLYTLATLDETVSFQVIGAIREILVAPESPETVLQRLCAPATHAVTMTVTEKGYCLGADGDLDLGHVDIRHDLQNPHAPVSLVGYLVEGLARRRAAGLRPFTVISCDNLADNGVRLSKAVVQLAATRDSGLAAWIEAECAFPRTMVDSITPATTDALKERVADALGVRDRWPVQREAFVQWVIEDRFSGDAPDWASVGATVTDDVPAYDRAKLRLLNGAHSTLAYVGLLMGHQTVAQAITDPQLSVFVRALMLEDILPTLKAPRGLDLRDYVQSILKRFHNSTIRHALAQIAWDGSQKLPIRLLGTIRDNLNAQRPIDRLCVPIAAWMHFVRRQAARGERVVDPLSERLFEIGGACQNKAISDLPRFFSLGTVFTSNLSGSAQFVSALSRAYDRLASSPVVL